MNLLASRTEGEQRVNYPKLPFAGRLRESYCLFHRVKAASLLALVMFAFLSGCAAQIPQPGVIGHIPAEKQTPTVSEDFALTLKDFGGEDTRFSLAVMKFDDLSGTRIEGGISTAVASSGKLLSEFLLTAPELDGKFLVFNREALTDLLNERRLAESYNESRKAKLIAEARPELQGLIRDSLKPTYELPDLHPVDLLLYGAVVGYDKDLIDDGAGAGLAGYSVKRERSLDQVHVMVQLVETVSGRIRSVGSASQVVGSTLNSGGYFGLLDPFRALEIEGGRASNDPRTIALLEALQEALLRMFKNA